MTTTRKLTIAETGSPVRIPVAVLAAQRIDAVVGSIIQLDGRKSYDPNKKRLFWKWRFVQVPLGSLLEDSSFRDIRPNSAAVSFTPDKTGFYVVELTVTNGDLISSPVTATIGIQLSGVPCGENIVPESRFLWDYISNFWSLVEDREVITSIWSSTMQLIGAELIKLWSADYDKSIATIQSNRQRRWQKLSSITELYEYADQRIIVGKNDSGTSGYTGTPGVKPGVGTTSNIYVEFGSVGSVTKSDFTVLKGNYGPKGRVIVANGGCYTIRSVGTIPLKMCDGSDGSTTALSNQLTSLSADFVNSGVKAGDQVQILSGSDSGTYLVSGVSATLLTVTATDGSSVSFLGSSGVSYTVTRYYSSASVVENEVPDGEVNVSWRIPNLLHIPGLNLEASGVRAGDVLVFDVARNDTGLHAEIRAQVVGVRGSRLGFEFEIEDLVAGEKAYSRPLFTQLVRDLKIVPPEWSDTDATKAANALIAFMPTGINLSARPFSTYRISFRAKKVIHNSVLVVDKALVSVPALQETPKDPPVVLRENLDYIVEGGSIQFLSGIFKPTDPSPEAWWAECVFYDNSSAIETNFGRLVGLLKNDFDLRQTKTSYLSAVKGLFYSYTTGPTLANVRLGLQILLGLPFSEERGVVLEVSPYFSKDIYGSDLGRILVEDLDDNDRKLGVRRFYFYPMSVGLEINSATGSEYAAGDIVDRFSPLSRGVEVTDYVKDPYWWKRAFYGMEILKFFSFYVSVDSRVFSEEARALAFDFISQIKATYTNVLVAAIKELEDELEFEHILGGSGGMVLYDAPFGTEAVKKTSDENGQGFTLWSAGYSKNYNDDAVYYPDDQTSRLMADRSYHTRTPRMLRDVRVYNDSGTYKAYTPTGWGSFIRVRRFISSALPAQPGDLLVVASAQDGSYKNNPSAYEIDSIIDGNTVSLKRADLAADYYEVGSPSLVGIPEGDNLTCCVVRRDVNPLVIGDDLQASASNNIVTSASAKFVSNSVGPGDLLVIESATNNGEYLVEALIPASPGPPFVPPSISETQVRLRNLDGSTPSLSTASGLLFRVVRPSLLPRMVAGCHSHHLSASLICINSFVANSTTNPQDAFLPELVGTYIPISRSYDVRSDGRYLVKGYVSAGVAYIDRSYIAGLNEASQRRAVVHLPDQTEIASCRILGSSSSNNYLRASSGSVGTYLYENTTPNAYNSFAKMANNGQGTWIMCARGSGAGNPSIFRTTNMSSWSYAAISSTSDTHPRDIAHDQAGRWVIVGKAGNNVASWTSTNGTSWSETSWAGFGGTGRKLMGVCYSPFHSKWFAIGTDDDFGYPIVFTSTDGSTWSGPAQLGSLSQRVGTAIAAKPDGRVVAIVCRAGSGNPSSYVSTDGGSTWGGPYDLGAAAELYFYSVFWNSGTSKWHAFGSGYLYGYIAAHYTSSDGVSWSSSTVPSSLKNIVSAGIYYDGSLVVSAVSSISDLPKAYVSSDGGSSWTELTMPTSYAVNYWCMSSRSTVATAFAGIKSSTYYSAAQVNYVIPASSFVLDPAYSGAPFSFEGPPSASPLRLGVLQGDRLHITGPSGAPNTGLSFTITSASGTALAVYQPFTSDPGTQYQYAIERRKS
jgi:hypothetical protein